MKVLEIDSWDNLPDDYTGTVCCSRNFFGASIRYWFTNGALHREDGPAVEYPDGYKAWYLNNNIIFDLLPKDQPFLILEETEDQVKILTATETKWIKNVSGLKELENNPCKQ